MNKESLEWYFLRRCYEKVIPFPLLFEYADIPVRKPMALWCSVIVAHSWLISRMGKYDIRQWQYSSLRFKGCDMRCPISSQRSEIIRSRWVMPWLSLSVQRADIAIKQGTVPILSTNFPWKCIPIQKMWQSRDHVERLYFPHSNHIRALSALIIMVFVVSTVLSIVILDFMVLIRRWPITGSHVNRCPLELISTHNGSWESKQLN